MTFQSADRESPFRVARGRPLTAAGYSTIFVTMSQPYLSPCHNHICHRVTTIFVTMSPPGLLRLKLDSEIFGIPELDIHKNPGIFRDFVYHKQTAIYNTWGGNQEVM